MANRKNTAPTVAAKAPRIVRAAGIVAAHGLAALPRIVAATGNAPASNRRYGATVNGLTPAFANATFTLTALGKAAVAANGCTGRNGQPTAMGLTALALGQCGHSASGAAIVAAIIGNPQLMAAMLGTKAQGTHILPGTVAAAKWAQGYVNGLCRPAHGLATKA